LLHPSARVDRRAIPAVPGHAQLPRVARGDRFGRASAARLSARDVAQPAAFFLYNSRFSCVPAARPGGFLLRVACTMPIYAYRCDSCGAEKDVLQKLSDAPLTVCPECGAEAFHKR